MGFGRIIPNLPRGCKGEFSGNFSGMKFTYAYKTSDGARHEAAMPADAFESFLDERNDELRNLGIRPVTLDD